jgi:hypothetical protein
LDYYTYYYILRDGFIRGIPTMEPVVKAKTNLRLKGITPKFWLGLELRTLAQTEPLFELRATNRG